MGNTVVPFSGETAIWKQSVLIQFTRVLQNGRPVFVYNETFLSGYIDYEPYVSQPIKRLHLIPVPQHLDRWWDGSNRPLSTSLVVSP